MKHQNFRTWIKRNEKFLYIYVQLWEYMRPNIICLYISNRDCQCLIKDNLFIILLFTFVSKLKKGLIFLEVAIVVKVICLLSEIIDFKFLYNINHYKRS
ncbi:unnamed protein product [Rhizophagus irregularis]|uniref:Uncharacterized protein n=1 Tax=Rhizophagus irregularis TaxID=588596 RepID=A0A915ZM62_9GLOM|nr:unnamed protein product [Rhizophagus irregularis]CAB5217114.1 unnamed protein product [Rhizophagus irregularis]CAB5380427.1 unnamed protein product [Rhizophagus irregularis]